MISLTYLSTAVAAFSIADLADVLSVSRRRNGADDLTGMLLYADGHFIQTLEGPDDLVRATFARVERDSRHRSVLVALEQTIETRAFPDWSMGFETLDGEDAKALPGFNDYLSSKPLPANGAKSFGNAGIFHRLFRDRMR